MTSVHDYRAKLNSGETKPLSDFKGSALLIVNVASQCGFTPQYAGLEELYRAHRDKGFEVLGFPCNQFGAQEPGDAAEIASFCRTRYDVTFPLFEKIEVNGPGAHPLFEHLKKAKPGLAGTRAIKWNFTKFLIDQAGNVRARYSPQTPPKLIEKDVVKLLADR